MVKRNQKLIDQFNREEERQRQLQWLKAKRRVRFSKLGELTHAILDLLDEMRERRRPLDCVGSKSEVERELDPGEWTETQRPQKAKVLRYCQFC